jgi:hypothetical protein
MLTTPTFNLHPWVRTSPRSPKERISAAQAAKAGAIRYRVYSGRRLLAAFNRRVEWPFIWDVGTRVQCSRRWHVVTAIRGVPALDKLG